MKQFLTLVLALAFFWVFSQGNASAQVPLGNVSSGSGVPPGNVSGGGSGVPPGNVSGGGSTVPSMIPDITHTPSPPFVWPEGWRDFVNDDLPDVVTEWLKAVPDLIKIFKGGGTPNTGGSTGGG